MNDETLALDAIMEVGSTAAFLAHEHTAAHFRKELWLPRIIRRLNPSAWNEEKPDMLSGRASEGEGDTGVITTRGRSMRRRSASWTR